MKSFLQCLAVPWHCGTLAVGHLCRPIDFLKFSYFLLSLLRKYNRWEYRKGYHNYSNRWVTGWAIYGGITHKGLGVLSIKCPKVDHRVLLINSDDPRVHTQSPKYWDIMGGGNQRDTKNLHGSNPEYIYF